MLLFISINKILHRSIHKVGLVLIYQQNYREDERQALNPKLLKNIILERINNIFGYIFLSNPMLNQNIVKAICQNEQAAEVQELIRALLMRNMLILMNELNYAYILSCRQN